MTNLNYSISGLKDLLVDLETLSTCITSLPKEHVNTAAFASLLDQQHQLIESINGYCLMLNAIALEPSLINH